MSIPPLASLTSRPPRSRPSVRGALLTSALAGLLGAGCTGNVDGVPAGGEGMTPADAPAKGGGKGDGTGGAPGGTGAKPGPVGDPNAAGPLPLQRLTRAEYNNTVRDLLGDRTRPGDAFPDEPLGANGFHTPGAVSGVDVNRFAEAAAQVASRAAKTVAALAPCAAPAGSDACAADFARKFGRRAFRRPLGDAEVTELVSLYGKLRAAPVSLDHASAIQGLVEAMLQAPQFLYRWELGPAAPTRDGALVRLNGHEVASRLSYLLWRSMPDDELFAAADAGKLGAAAEVEKQARRLLKDPRARETLEGFHAQWLELEGIANVQKDTKVFPEFDPQLRAAMADETRTFVGEVLSADGSLATLLSAPYSFVNEKLAGIYGLQGVKGAELRKTPLDPAQRMGLLTQAGFLALHAQTYEGSPVKRGKILRERLLCQPIAPPPDDVDPTPPKVDPNLQTRERYAAHSEVGICRGCHMMMDPLGFAFESYDGVGRFRTTEAGRPVDTTGTLVGLDGPERPFKNAKELIGIVLASPELRSCAATQWLRYALGRKETDQDRAALGLSLDALAKSNLDVRELLVALTKSKSFLFRAPGPGEVL